MRLSWLGVVEALEAKLVVVGEAPEAELPMVEVPPIPSVMPEVA